MRDAPKRPGGVSGIVWWERRRDEREKPRRWVEDRRLLRGKERAAAVDVGRGIPATRIEIAVAELAPELVLSAASGKVNGEHGVFGIVRPDSDVLLVTPISRTVSPFESSAYFNIFHCSS